MLHANDHRGLLHWQRLRLLHLRLLNDGSVAPVRRERTGDTMPEAGDD